MLPILESIENITNTAQDLLQQSNSTFYPQLKVHNYRQFRMYEVVAICIPLQALFTLNQHLLNALGVGHPAIDRVCTLAESQGLSAKLTGGGGGGCVMVLIPSGKALSMMAKKLLITIYY